MLKNAWYAVATCESIQDTPQKVSVHGEAILLYRDNHGTVSAMDAYCPHRGCDLSLGRVDGDGLVCPYHGWRFSTDGRCIHIPANRAGFPIPDFYRVKTYPVQDAVGLIWVYTNPDLPQEEVPSLLVFPELTNEQFRGIPFHVQWSAHFSRVVESVLDISHLPFVHPETTGEEVLPIVNGPECHVTQDRLVIYPSPFASSHPMDPVPEDWVDANSNRRTEIEMWLPNHWMIRTPVGDSDWMCTYLTFTPVGEDMTHIYGSALRDFEPDNDFLDEFHIEHTTFVMAQDQRIVESQRPRQSPFDLQQECHVASDAPPLRFRTMLRQALNREIG